MKFRVTKTDDRYWVAVKTNSVFYEHVLAPEAAQALAEALKTNTDLDSPTVSLVSLSGDQFDLSFKAGCKLKIGYTVGKRKLSELRMALMGALNG